MSFKQYFLRELFNTKQQTDWMFDGDTYHSILEGPGGITYMLKLEPFWDLALPGEAYNVKQMSPEQWQKLDKGSWHVEFETDSSSKSLGITGDQGTKSSRVFSLIGNAIVDKVKEKPDTFRNLIFSAYEPNRQSLYTRIAPILAKTLNKDVAISDDGKWFFLLQKD